MTALKVKKALKSLADPEKAKQLSRFFKTGVGEYGEGDVFWGITVPNQRQVVKEFKEMPLGEALKLLKSKIHEHRLTALLIMVWQYERGDEKNKERIFTLYLKNTRFINSWDLVDLSAPKIIGTHLLAHPEKRKILEKLARSKDLWERRIAVLATNAFIKAGQYQETLKLAKLLLRDEHDLIHKAVGWMLREVGKKNQLVEEKFLERYGTRMPRTMLRYAIERFSPKKRADYLQKK